MQLMQGFFNEKVLIAHIQDNSSLRCCQGCKTHGIRGLREGVYNLPCEESRGGGGQNLKIKMQKN